MDFAVSADPKVKELEGEKLDQYMDLARELRKRWNMKATVIPIVIVVLGTVLKNLKKRLDE